jgi:hypothetical protein
MSNEPDPMTPPEWYRPPVVKAPPKKPDQPPEVPYPLSDKAAFEASKEALPWVEDAPAYACKIRSKERAAFMRGYKACSEVAMRLLAPDGVPDLLRKIAGYQEEMSRLMDENRRVMGENEDHIHTIQFYIAQYRKQEARIKDLEEAVDNLRTVVRMTEPKIDELVARIKDLEALIERLRQDLDQARKERDRLLSIVKLCAYGWSSEAANQARELLIEWGMHET